MCVTYLKSRADERELTSVLAVYVFSVVGGRVYTGMHSLGTSLTPIIELTISRYCWRIITGHRVLGAVVHTRNSRHCLGRFRFLDRYAAR